MRVLITIVIMLTIVSSYGQSSAGLSTVVGRSGFGGIISHNRMYFGFETGTYGQNNEELSLERFTFDVNIIKTKFGNLMIGAGYNNWKHYRGNFEHINPESLKNYCISVGPNIRIRRFNLIYSYNLTQKENRFALTYVFADNRCKKDPYYF